MVVVVWCVSSVCEGADTIRGTASIQISNNATICCRPGQMCLRAAGKRQGSADWQTPREQPRPRKRVAAAAVAVVLVVVVVVVVCRGQLI